MSKTSDCRKDVKNQCLEEGCQKPVIAGRMSKTTAWRMNVKNQCLEDECQKPVLGG